MPSGTVLSVSVDIYTLMHFITSLGIFFGGHTKSLDWHTSYYSYSYRVTDRQTTLDRLQMAWNRFRPKRPRVITPAFICDSYSHKDRVFIHSEPIAERPINLLKSEVEFVVNKQKRIQMERVFLSLSLLQIFDRVNTLWAKNDY